MSYIDYNSEENSISLVKASKRFKEDYSVLDTDENFQIIKKNDDFIGIKLLDFLSELEHKGRTAEDVFKILLDNNNVPYLYIGQGPVGIEYSEVLKKITHSKRPDFLINIPDIGVLFIDVKCRRKIGFSNKGKKYFQLFINEIKSLINLYEQILIPVWIAFYDENSIESQEEKFQLIPISMLKKYLNGISKELSEREYTMLSSIRISDDLLNEINETLIFKAGVHEVEESIILDFSNKHKGLVRRIEDGIRNLIRNEDILKSKVSDKLLEQLGKEMFFKAEIELMLKYLIEENAIIYERKRPLRLLGES